MSAKLIKPPCVLRREQKEAEEEKRRIEREKEYSKNPVEIFCEMTGLNINEYPELIKLRDYLNEFVCSNCGANLMPRKTRGGVLARIENPAICDICGMEFEQLT